MSSGEKTRAKQLGIDSLNYGANFGSTAFAAYLDKMIELGRLTTDASWIVAADATAVESALSITPSGMIQGLYLGRGRDAQRGVQVCSEAQMEAVLEKLGKGKDASLVSLLTVFVLSTVGQPDDTPIRPVVLALYGHDAREKAGDFSDLLLCLRIALEARGILVDAVVTDNYAQERCGALGSSGVPHATEDQLGSGAPLTYTVFEVTGDPDIDVYKFLNQLLGRAPPTTTASTTTAPLESSSTATSARSSSVSTAGLAVPTVPTRADEMARLRNALVFVDPEHGGGSHFKRLISRRVKRPARMSKAAYARYVKDKGQGGASSQAAYDNALKVFDVVVGRHQLQALLTYYDREQELSAPGLQEDVRDALEDLSVAELNELLRNPETDPALVAAVLLAISYKDHRPVAKGDYHPTTDPNRAFKLPFTSEHLANTSGPTVMGFAHRVVSRSTAGALKAFSHIMEGAAELSILVDVLHNVTRSWASTVEGWKVEAFYVSVCDAMETMAWMNDYQVAKGYRGVGLTVESMAAIEMNYGSLTALLQRAGADPERYAVIKVNQLASQICEVIFGMLRTMTSMFGTRSTFDIVDGGRRLQKLLLLLDAIDSAMAQSLSYMAERERTRSLHKADFRDPGYSVGDARLLQPAGLHTLRELGATMCVKRLHKRIVDAAATEEEGEDRWREIEAAVKGLPGNENVAGYWDRVEMCERGVEMVDIELGEKNTMMNTNDVSWAFEFAEHVADAGPRASGASERAQPRSATGPTMLSTARPTAYIRKYLMKITSTTPTAPSDGRATFAATPTSLAAEMRALDGKTKEDVGRVGGSNDNVQRITMLAKDGTRKSAKQLLKMVVRRSAIPAVAKGASDCRTRYNQSKSSGPSGVEFPLTLATEIVAGTIVVIMTEENTAVLALVASIVKVERRSRGQAWTHAMLALKTKAAQEAEWEKAQVKAERAAEKEEKRQRKRQARAVAKATAKAGNTTSPPAVPPATTASTDMSTSTTTTSTSTSVTHQTFGRKRGRGKEDDDVQPMDLQAARGGRLGGGDGGLGGGGEGGGGGGGGGGLGGGGLGGSGGVCGGDGLGGGRGGGGLDGGGSREGGGDASREGSRDRQRQPVSTEHRERKKNMELSQLEIPVYGRARVSGANLMDPLYEVNVQPVLAQWSLPGRETSSLVAPEDHPGSLHTFHISRVVTTLASDSLRTANREGRAYSFVLPEHCEVIDQLCVEFDERHKQYKELVATGAMMAGNQSRNQ